MTLLHPRKKQQGNVAAERWHDITLLPPRTGTSLQRPSDGWFYCRCLRINLMLYNGTEIFCEFATSVITLRLSTNRWLWETPSGRRERLPKVTMKTFYVATTQKIYRELGKQKAREQGDNWTELPHTLKHQGSTPTHGRSALCIKKMEHILRALHTAHGKEPFLDSLRWTRRRTDCSRESMDISAKLK